MKNKTPLYIFDLDGTLADIEHRLYLIEQDKQEWELFFWACIDDKPIEHVIRILELLAPRADIWIWTGRDEICRQMTVEWIEKFVGISAYQLWMRMHGDHQQDSALKQLWLESMHEDDRSRLVAVFEDRNQVVQMFRQNGVTCYQVNEGNF